MHKLLRILYSHFLLVNLYSSESIVATLHSIPSNSVQEFSISHSRFLCHHYGLVTIEELSHNTKLSSVCQKSIEEFYLKHPDLKQYAQKKLKIMQRYKIEFKKRECILYSDGQMSYSELLLKSGLAVVKPVFLDKEFKYAFNKAQENAKLLKIGIWKEEVIKNCMESLYKN
jgi:hypothetical protein